MSFPEGLLENGGLSKIYMACSQNSVFGKSREKNIEENLGCFFQPMGLQHSLLRQNDYTRIHSCYWFSVGPYCLIFRALDLFRVRKNYQDLNAISSLLSGAWPGTGLNKARCAAQCIAQTFSFEDLYWALMAGSEEVEGTMWGKKGSLDSSCLCFSICESVIKS